MKEVQGDFLFCNLALMVVVAIFCLGACNTDSSTEANCDCLSVHCGQDGSTFVDYSERACDSEVTDIIRDFAIPDHRSLDVRIGGDSDCLEVFVDVVEEEYLNDALLYDRVTDIGLPDGISGDEGVISDSPVGSDVLSSDASADEDSLGSLGLLGDSCTMSSDCAQGPCLAGANGSVCSQGCMSHSDCNASGFICLALDIWGKRCVPFRTMVCTTCVSDTDCYDPVTKLQHFCMTDDKGESWCHQTAGYPCGSDYLGEIIVDSSTGESKFVCMPKPGVECGCTAYGIEHGNSMVCNNGPATGACVGERHCTEAGLTECSSPGPSVEVCNGVDDDCDGQTDEGVPDLDGDGTPDCLDLDADGDGVPDGVDTCATNWDPDQQDFNGDGVGDACSDVDGDSVVDAADNCRTVFNSDQADFNGDGLGDACSDVDHDSVVDAADNCPKIFNLSFVKTRLWVSAARIRGSDGVAQRVF